VRTAVARGGEGSEADQRARVVLDREGTMPGRGAYLCRGEDAGLPAAACVAVAIRRGGIGRTLHASVAIDPEIVESMGR